MSNAIVLDASVAIKLVLVEEFSDRAEALFETTVRGGYRVVGLPLLNTEVTNGIYQYLRRRLITSSEASRVLAQFLSLGIEIVEPTGLYGRALAFAERHGLKNIYDGSYIVLAQVLGVELWTDDRGLLSTAGPAVNWMRWIGDYPIG